MPIALVSPLFCDRAASAMACILRLEMRGCPLAPQLLALGRLLLSVWLCRATSAVCLCYFVHGAIRRHRGRSPLV